MENSVEGHCGHADPILDGLYPTGITCSHPT